MNEANPIDAHLRRSLAALERASQDAAVLETARQIAAAMVAALSTGNKLLIIGNGGSAADAQHIAAEIVGRYERERPAYPALARRVDESHFREIACHQAIEALAQGAVPAQDAVLAQGPDLS